MMEAITKRLIQARKNAGLNQMQVARLLGLSSASSFTAVEDGGASLTLERFLKLCEIYDVDETWVLTGVNPNFNLEEIIGITARSKMAADELADLVEMLQSLKQRPRESESPAE